MTCAEVGATGVIDVGGVTFDLGTRLIDAESNLKAALAGMQKADAPAAKPAAVGHKAVGVLNAIDAAAGTVTVSHEPVASLKWPAMKMDFVLANPSLVAGMKPGAGEWVVTSLVKK